MALSDRVKERISDQLLKELTNQGDPSATTVNDVRLGFAAQDIEAEFLIETGLDYDEADDLHVAAATQGVLVKLMEYTGITGRNTDQLSSRYNRMLLRIATTRGSEQRASPTSSSTLDPSTERAGSRPDQDRSRWRGFVPNAVGGAADDDDDE